MGFVGLYRQAASLFLSETNIVTRYVRPVKGILTTSKQGAIPDGHQVLFGLQKTHLQHQSAAYNIYYVQVMLVY